MTFGQMLQRHIDRGTRGSRPGLRWKLSDLADEIGVDEKTLYAWRKGRERPHDIRTLLRVVFGDQDNIEKSEMIDAWRLLLPGAPERMKASPPNIPATGLCLGREREAHELVDALLEGPGASALVLGGPGFGKSTLTKLAARDERIVRAFGNRRWFVSLEAAYSAGHVIERIGNALGVPAGGIEDLALHMEEGPSLLVLDNLETPWWEDRDGVEALLKELVSIPRLSLLASVRGDETVDGPRWNRQCWLRPLTQTPATEMFHRIAGRIDKEDSELPYFLDERTGVLGGIPLAIRLIAIVAGREGALAPVRVQWQRVGIELADRLGEADGRLDSIIQSIAVSVASPRLNSKGLALFSLLGASLTGLTATDGEALMPGSWRKAMSQLRAVGLVEGRDRADLLPPVRDFASRFYPLGDDVAERWRTHFLELVAVEGARVGTAGGVDPLERLLPELPNIEAALESAGRAGSIAHATAVAAGLSDTIRFGGLEDVRALDRLSEFCVLSQDRYAAAAALYYGGLILLDRSKYDGAETRCGQALVIFRKEERRLGEANALKALADIDYRRGNFDDAAERVAAALDLYRAESNLLGQANCVSRQASIARQRKSEEVEFLYREAIRLYGEAGASLGHGNCLFAMGEIAFENDNLAAAKELFAEALPKLADAGDLLGAANCNLLLGDTCCLLGENEEAFKRVDLALEGFRTLGDIDTQDGEAQCLEILGTLHAQSNNLDRATAHFEASKILYLNSNNVSGVGHCEHGLGRIAELLGDSEAALRRYREALACYNQSQDAHCIEKLEALIAALRSGS
jgi:tetratricopeptide (TPR) repeat protein